MREFGPRLNLPEAEIRDYLDRDLAYGLGERELQALRLFYDLCAARGILAATRDLEFARVERDIVQT